MSLLLLRLHDVSIGIISDDTGDLSDLDFFFFLVLGRSGDVGADSDGSFVGDAGAEAGDAGTGAGVFGGSGSLAVLGGPLFSSFELLLSSPRRLVFGLDPVLYFLPLFP